MLFGVKHDMNQSIYIWMIVKEFSIGSFPYHLSILVLWTAMLLYILMGVLGEHIQTIDDFQTGNYAQN